MSCPMTLELTAYLDDALSAEQRENVEKHVPTCAECTETLGLLKRTFAQIPVAPPFEPSPELRRNVMRRIDALPPSLSARWAAWFKPQRWVPATALAGAMAVLAVVSIRNQSAQRLDELELASNLDVVQDLDVLGMDGAEDVDVVASLHELEPLR